MKNCRMSWMIILLMGTLLFIMACSGGSGSGKVNGVAAAGAPINGQVTLKDQNGTEVGPITIASDGTFSFDVAGLTPPFILKAEGKVGSDSYTLYSMLTGTGRGNINPLTHLILAVAAGGDPATLYGATGAAPVTADLTDEALQAALAQVKTLLQLLLDEYGITNFDPINGDYEANPVNRLDAMLDVLNFQVTTSGALTITNKLTGTVIGSGIVTDLSTVTLNKTDAPAESSLTDIREITDRVAALGVVMASSSALTTASLEDFFIADPQYGTSASHTRTEDIASILTIFGPGGTNTHGTLLQLKNVQIVRDVTNDYYIQRGVSKVYIINYDFIYENEVVRGTNVKFGKEIASGNWKIIGYPNVLYGVISGPVNYAGGLTPGIGVTFNNVIAGDNVGGLVGYAVNQGTYSPNIGGLVGNLTTTGDISGSYATGHVTGSIYVGGLVGNCSTVGAGNNWIAITGSFETVNEVATITPIDVLTDDAENNGVALTGN